MSAHVLVLWMKAVMCENDISIKPDFDPEGNI